VLRGAYLELEIDEIATITTHTHGRFYRLSDGRCEELVAHRATSPPEDLLG
jgi:hypothetical protein